MLRFLKNWTLPVAMCVGALAYFLFAGMPWLAPLKPIVWTLSSVLTPVLIFSQLLLTFCKVDPKDLKPVAWHGWLLLFQLVGCLLLAAVLWWVPLSDTYREVFESAMVCIICPTATAAAVITGKLGGNAGSLTTFTLLSNILAAVVVPLLFPLIEVHAGGGFFSAFASILLKVFPLLLCPFIAACILRYFLPKVRAWLAGISNLAFYLWGISLAIVSGQTVRSIATSDAEAIVKWLIALAGLLACCLQFFVGKRIGTHYGERISAGQALGQKNTVLAIWMAYTYLNPLCSVGPGSYVLWQNLINSYQLWKKRKNEC